VSATPLSDRVSDYLTRLTAYPDRHVGGEGNRAATQLFAEVAEGFGLTVRRVDFDCLEWEYGAASAAAGGERFALDVGPYSHPCELRASLVAASSVEQLETLDAEGKVLLLHGEIASGQLMPKNFVWYNPEEHKHIYGLLEAKSPAAVIAATGRDPELVGSQYPFPLFEDGDFETPNAYMTDVEGKRLLAHVGEEVALRIDSERIPVTAEHLVAFKQGDAAGRIVVSAHIDSRKGSPGALDNASGVATLLAVAELLGDYTSGPTVEFVPFNGEDNYANPGEMLWAAENEGRFGDIVLGINIDDSGQRGAVNNVSLYGCPEELERIVLDAARQRNGIEPGPQWYQGDHMILVQNKAPAIAIASSEMERFMAEYAHSERDRIELADPVLIAETARYLRDVVGRVAEWATG